MKTIFSAISIDYTLPNNKEQLLFDFYVSTMMKVKDSKLTKRDESQFDIYDTALDVKKQMYGQLKEKILNDVFYSICCEFRHFNRQSYFIFKTDKGNNGIKKTFELKDSNGMVYEMKKKFLDFMLDYHEEYNSKIEEKVKKNQRRYGDDSESEVNQQESREISNDVVNLLIKKGSISKYEFVDLCENVFLAHGAWASSYGGKPWSSICKGWKKLYKANSLDETMIWIDHIFDLQHNTGSVFNKLEDWNMRVWKPELKNELV